MQMQSQTPSQQQYSNTGAVQYPVFNTQKKWKRRELKASTELCVESKNVSNGNIDIKYPVNKPNIKNYTKSPTNSQSKFIFMPKEKETKITPILTMAELEQIQFNSASNSARHSYTNRRIHSRSRSASNSPVSNISISPEPLHITTSSISTSNIVNISQSPSQSPIPILSESTMGIGMNMHMTMPMGMSRPNPIPRPSICPSPSPIPQPIEQIHHIEQISMSPVPMSPVPMSPVPMSPVSLFNHKYNLHKNLINTIKALVFQNSCLICGIFNSQQFIIDEYFKTFLNYIMYYEFHNNIKFTSQQINNLFMDESFSPETKQRLELQNSIEILTTVNRMKPFIDSITQYFGNTMQNTIPTYKVEHINKGNIKNLIDQTNDLQIYFNTHNDMELYLHIVKISIPEHNVIFEIRFLILDNEKTKIDKSYMISLYIPRGLYHAENLHITNNGNDMYDIQHSSSSINYIINNINMKIVSLMPKINDYDFKKISKYVLQIMNTNSNFCIYEFDFFNTMHKKSDFWLCNKNKEENAVQDTQAPQTIHDTTHVCNKCNINISTNAKYVISKCCHKKYHIECMEMNYYPNINIKNSYLLCDCGFSCIDENECNSKLLIALYKNYY